MPQLDPTWFVSQLFWLAVTFTFLYVLLSRLALPPLQDVLERRLQTREQDIASAEAMKQEAETAKAEYERALKESREKAQALLVESALASKANAEKAGRDLDAQVSRQLTEASQRIETKKNELKAALTPSVGELASLIVTQLTQVAPKADRVAAAVDAVSKQNKG